MTKRAARSGNSFIWLCAAGGLTAFFTHPPATWALKSGRVGKACDKLCNLQFVCVYFIFIVIVLLISFTKVRNNCVSSM